MRKTVLFIAMSVDGRIADQKGSVDWLYGHGDESDAVDSYAEFIKGIDTVLMGWNTYHQVVTELVPEAWPYAGLKTYVFTHRACESSNEVVFTDEDPTKVIERLRAEPGKDIWVCGGANVVNQLMKDDMIDRFHLSIIPALLGEGPRLFNERFKQSRLRLIDVKAYDGITDLVYEKIT